MGPPGPTFRCMGDAGTLELKDRLAGEGKGVPAADRGRLVPEPGRPIPAGDLGPRPPGLADLASPLLPA